MCLQELKILRSKDCAFKGSISKSSKALMPAVGQDTLFFPGHMCVRGLSVPCFSEHLCILEPACYIFQRIVHFPGNFFLQKIDEAKKGVHNFVHPSLGTHPDALKTNLPWVYMRQSIVETQAIPRIWLPLVLSIPSDTNSVLWTKDNSKCSHRSFQNIIF